MYKAMQQRIRTARQEESGFTLIELLIVIVILGVLAGIVVFAVSGITDKGQTSACKSDYKEVETAIESWYADSTNASYPTDNAAAYAKVVPGYLHSWPGGVPSATNPTLVTVSADGSGFKVVGAGDCASTPNT